MKFFFLFMLLSCSLSRFERSEETISKEVKEVLTYTDSDGKYNLKREIKVKDGKLASRVKLFPLTQTKEFESTVSVSKIGSLIHKGKKSISLLPEVSQYRVWFNKKEYFSQLKINREARRIEVYSKGPEKKWNFEKNYTLPKGVYFCFFSQLPECLKMQNLLLKSARKKLQVFVIWDNFPYHNELYDGLDESPFVNAVLNLDKHDKKSLKYSLDLGNQIIFLQYDRDLNFKAIYWVTQGISAVSINKE